MKYIRAKDGRIVKFGEQTDIGYEKGTFEVHNKIGIVASYEPIEVLKEANTIEELCDEFVMISDGKHKLDIGCHSYSDEKIQIYGAIWTDKGLIYVAKMNEKGKLELL
jgi:hypothetical protein